MSSPLLSIIICTRNRARSLRETLACFERLEIPADYGAELLVVDNASTDQTEDVVRRRRFANLNVRYLRENTPGLSWARNIGLGASAGEIILFTDDDVRPSPGWARGMCQPLLSGKADAVAGGVTVAPGLLTPWMTLWVRATLAATDSINPVTPERMVGANMAFSRRVLARVPAFDAELGAGPCQLGAAEETLFTYQLAEAGYRIASAFDVNVEHHLDPSRLTRRALLGACERAARSEAYVAWHWAHESPQVCDRSLRSYKRDLKLWAKLLRHRINAAARHDAPPIDDWEIQLVKALFFRRQYRIEMLRPRNYDRRGFTKRAVRKVA